MLCVTNDGRKIGLDQRLMNPLLPDDPNSKLNACVRNVLRIWEEGKEERLTQLLFCDLSTPKGDGQFNVYSRALRNCWRWACRKPRVAFIHTADTEAKKKELFSKVRTGQVRILLGSTAKMGAGTNVQDRLVAVHHLDVGWKPSDMTQRNGAHHPAGATGTRQCRSTTTSRKGHSTRTCFRPLRINSASSDRS